ncbi:MAG TPA: glycosyltransferase [Candidatus Eisenbacteria bacterium]|nr:glycosyltransferase [Candidatus Eisenbacteria bacterium]
MRVLLVNAFHWLKGGVERTYFDDSRWLAAAGHEVAHFATQDPRNLPDPHAACFAPAADYGEETPAWRQLGQLPRAIWSAPAARALARLLADWRADVAHVHAPSRYLTPSVLRALARARVPAVMTLHDFKPWCTNRVLFARGAVCERCRGGRHWHAAAIGCVQHSRAKSLVGALEAYAHDRAGAYRDLRLWIAPSRFVRDQAASLGAEPARLRVLAHGVEAPAAAAPPVDLPARCVLYAGRLSEEKGVRLLPALAAAIAPVPLVVAGDGPLAAWLRARAVPGLRQLGHLDAGALAAVVARAAVVVVPSLFYETFGYAVAEALLAARAVVASRIGALPELVEDGRTGLLVPPGDAGALAAAVRRALADPAAAAWGAAGRAHVLRLADPAAHVRGLLALYGEATTP